MGSFAWEGIERILGESGGVAGRESEGEGGGETEFLGEAARKVDP